MSDFWEGVSGSEKDAHQSGMQLIPDDTYAVARMAKVSFDEAWNKFKVEWTILDGPYKSRKVWQNLDVYNPKPEKARRARNMMMRLFSLCEVDRPEGVPTVQSFFPLANKIIGIKVQEYSFENNEGKTISGNWISELHKTDDNFIEKTKDDSIPIGIPSNPSSDEDDYSDDIPF